MLYKIQDTLFFKNVNILKMNENNEYNFFYQVEPETPLR